MGGEPYNTLNHFKAAVTARLLVYPADDNYYLARWCRINKFHAEFFWQAQQALEKYLKAALVVNNVPTQGLRHDLCKAFDLFENRFGDLSIQDFKKPRLLKDILWRPKSPKRFLEKIKVQGSPDSRYRLVSWHSDPNDLFMLDQFVYSLRRLTIGIDWTIGSDWKLSHYQKRYQGQKYADVIRSRPKFQPRGRINVPTGSASLAGASLEDAFFSWNFSFRRSHADLTKQAPSSVSSIIGALSNSETFLLYERLKTATRTNNPILLDGIRWFIDHFHLDKDSKIAFEQELKEAAQRP